MRAMVLAAGLGTRLRPLTYEITKPMVPVLDRPVMEHIVDLLDRHGFDEVIANLHYFPDTIREHFGERLAYRYEEELLGTAGGVRGVRRLLRRRAVPGHLRRRAHGHRPGRVRRAHRAAGGVATLAVKQVPDTREYGVVLHDRDGRITGFQEKPAPEEALSDLGNCGIYLFEPSDLRLLPGGRSSTGARTFPGAAEERRAVPHPRDARVLERRRLARRSFKKGAFDALARTAAPPRSRAWRSVRE